MVEHRKFGNLVPHLILWIGVVIVAFPVYLAFVASTHELDELLRSPMPLMPGARASRRPSESGRCTA